jgi:hypothetical protein
VRSSIEGGIVVRSCEQFEKVVWHKQSNCRTSFRKLLFFLSFTVFFGPEHAAHERFPRPFLQSAGKMRTAAKAARQSVAALLLRRATPGASVAHSKSARTHVAFSPRRERSLRMKSCGRVNLRHVVHAQAGAMGMNRLSGVDNGPDGTVAATIPRVSSATGFSDRPPR